jgi:hypothetical protein
MEATISIRVNHSEVTYSPVEDLLEEPTRALDEREEIADDAEELIRVVKAELKLLELAFTAEYKMIISKRREARGCEDCVMCT